MKEHVKQNDRPVTAFAVHFLSIVAVLLVLTGTLPVNAQYSGNNYGSSQFSQRVHSQNRYEYLNRNNAYPGWQRRMDFEQQVKPASINGWNNWQERTNKDLEQFANQLAVCLLIPHPGADPATNTRLVQELNGIRAQVSVLGSNRNYNSSYRYWKSQVQQVRARISGLDALVLRAETNPLLIDKWWKVKNDVDQWMACFY